MLQIELFRDSKEETQKGSFINLESLNKLLCLRIAPARIVSRDDSILAVSKFCNSVNIRNVCLYGSYVIILDCNL